jgi:hypothetical protein
MLFVEKLIHNDQQVADWFNISREGEKLLTRNARYERWEKLGVDRQQWAECPSAACSQPFDLQHVANPAYN